MGLELFKKALLLFGKLGCESNGHKTQLSFHGGEPLLAGTAFYKNALPDVNEVFGNAVNIGIQSNLWDINDEFIELFKRYKVNVGSSLDGPQEINDNQRCPGYFRNTFQSIEKLEKQGIYAACIATFTSRSAVHYKEVFDFFLKNKMPFDIHSAVKPFNYKGDNQLFLSPEEYGELLVNLLEYYLPHTDKIKIGTLDTLIKNVSHNKSGLCTFTKCLGNYLAIDPCGDLYTCNRFVGNKEFSIGNINKVNSWGNIKQSTVWQKLNKWQQTIENECADCLHKNICHGGCPYTAFSTGKGELVKDPNCEAYKMIYDFIINRGTKEFFSDENMEAISKEGSSHLKKGALLQIMNNDPHPYDIAIASKKIITAALFGLVDNITAHPDVISSLGIFDSNEITSDVVKKLHAELIKPKGGFINLYLHITGNCNLSCSHCYAYSAEESRSKHLPIDKLTDIIKEASEVALKKIIITGGEPLLHPNFEDLLDNIIELRKSQRLPKIVLRTNLSSVIESNILEKITASFDQIAISLDGSESLHDTRRGKGSYAQIISNLQRFNEKTLNDKITLSTVFDYQNLSRQIIENEKHHIIKLKENYQLSDLRFLPLLPLGRAENKQAKRPEAENISIAEWITRGHYPRSSCGIGYNLMIDSNGSAYPCHVYKKEAYTLNSIYDKGLKEILETDTFSELRSINVDTIEKCHKCGFRYICGGACHIWQNDDCSDLYLRAKNLFLEALDNLKISIEDINKFCLESKNEKDSPAVQLHQTSNRSTGPCI